MTALYHPRPERWPRVSLRGFFALLTSLGLVLGWTIHKAREQGIAVAALKETAGNDYEFASQWQSAEPYTPILSTLRTRCAVCHHQDGTHVTTFGLHGVPPEQKARELSPAGNERAIYTAGLKSERDDFKNLVRNWP